MFAGQRQARDPGWTALDARLGKLGFPWRWQRATAGLQGAAEERRSAGWNERSGEGGCLQKPKGESSGSGGERAGEGTQELTTEWDKV